MFAHRSPSTLLFRYISSGFVSTDPLPLCSSDIIQVDSFLIVLFLRCSQVRSREAHGRHQGMEWVLRRPGESRHSAGAQVQRRRILARHPEGRGHEDDGRTGSRIEGMLLRPFG
jgi:hypothetical protein